MDTTVRLERRHPTRALLVGLLLAVSVIALPSHATADPAGDAGVSADLVNQTRAQYGLNRLVPDRELQVVANRQANRMARSGGIFHSGNLGDQLSRGWWTWGENVGFGPSVEWIHDAFMGSGSHASTILYGPYNSVGVGVAYGSNGTVYVAQVFGAW